MESNEASTMVESTHSADDPSISDNESTLKHAKSPLLRRGIFLSGSHAVGNALMRPHPLENSWSPVVPYDYMLDAIIEHKRRKKIGKQEPIAEKLEEHHRIQYPKTLSDDAVGDPFSGLLRSAWRWSYHNGISRVPEPDDTESWQPDGVEDCAMCPEKGTLYCNQCRAITYCSLSCLEEDRLIHKLLCEQYVASYSEEHRPGKKFYRALYFPVDKEWPEFVWIKPGKDKKIAQFLERDQLRLFGRATNEEWGYENLWPLPFSKFHKMIHGIVAVFKGSLASASDCKINTSHKALGPPGHLRPWRGPCLIQARHPATKKVEDFSLRDFRYVVDHRRWNLDNYCITDPSRARFLTVNAIKVNCKGDMIKFKIPECNQVESVVNWRYDPWLREDVCCTAWLCGLKWFVRVPELNKDNLTSDEALIPMGLAMYNSIGLAFTIQLGMTNIGVLGLSTDVRSGTVLVMHERGFKLHPLHIDAFSEFVRIQLVGLNRLPWSSREVVDAFSQANFTAFWEAYIAKRGEDVPSPYELENSSEGEIIYVPDEEAQNTFELLLMMA